MMLNDINHANPYRYCIASQERRADSVEISHVMKITVKEKKKMLIIRWINLFRSKLQIQNIKYIIPKRKASTKIQSKKEEKDPSNMTYGIA